MASAGILGIIVGKLYHGKKLCPIILLNIDESLKIGFYYTILPFGLTIYLWVEGGEESPLDAEEIV